MHFPVVSKRHENGAGSVWIVRGGLGVSLDENPVRSTREMTTGAQQHAIMKLAWRFVRSSGREPVEVFC